MSQAAKTFRWQIRGRGVTDPAVLAAMEHVPRELFVPPDCVSEAYADHPLPIGHGQTISQPYIVAAMSAGLRLDSASRVLEIGTGSGYQTAILAEIAQTVFTVERIPALAQRARALLSHLGYANIAFRIGDGAQGWPQEEPYDAILLTCAPKRVPQALIDQLADGGRLLAPIGPAGGAQTLWRLERHGKHIKRQRLMSVAFVPLISQQHTGNR